MDLNQEYMIPKIKYYTHNLNSIINIKYTFFNFIAFSNIKIKI